MLRGSEVFSELDALIKTGERGEQGLIADYGKKKEEIIGKYRLKGEYSTGETITFSLLSFVPVAGGITSTALINELSEVKKQKSEMYTE